MNGSQEFPSNNSLASGSFTGVYDDATGILSVGTFTISNFANSLSASHIHIGNPGANGGVIVNLPAGDWMNMGGGMYHWNGAGSFTIPTTNRTAFLANGTYFNIHSNVFPGGEIRGRILLTPVPEPATMTALGLGALALLRRRRK